MTIAGVAVDPSGQPVAHARINALPVGGTPQEGVFVDDEQQLHSGADGRFVFPHMKPGRWVLRGDNGARAVVDAGDERVRFVTSPEQTHALQ